MDDDEDVGTVTVCQGPPRCLLQGDDAVDAAMFGCVWCKRITVYADGSETVREPVEA